MNKRKPESRVHQQPRPMAPSDKHHINFDVMLVLPDGDERYLCTMTMPHSELFETPYEEYEKFVIDQRPSLAHRKFRIAM